MAEELAVVVISMFTEMYPTTLSEMTGSTRLTAVSTDASTATGFEGRPPERRTTRRPPRTSSSYGPGTRSGAGSRGGSSSNGIRGRDLTGRQTSLMVEKALPECIRKTLKRECRDWKVRDRELLHRFSKGSYATWIERLRRIQGLSRLRLKQSMDYIEAGQYDEPPLPAVLVTFKEHDAITACFDEEGQYMMEGTAEPTLCVVFSPRRADEVRHALRIVERFVALNCEFFQLVEAIQEWEKRYEGSCIDRGEPSLRAA